MKQLYFILALIFISHNVSSQITSDSISLSLAEHHKLPKESIFLHLNKTDFIKDETLWFKGYIINQQNFKPSLETTNIHVSLLDSKGNSKESFLFLAKDGYVEGNIKLDSTFTSGNYYLKAETLWMKNFKDSKAFLEKFKILDEAVLTTQPLITNYDVQFLPEGGNILHGSNNVIGVKSVNNNGYGVKIKNGKIFDQDDTFIKSFETEIHGLGKFLLYAEKNKKYHALVEFEDGSRQTFILPASNSEGVALSVKNNSEQDFIAFEFNTNLKSLNPNGSLIAHYLIHKNGKSSLNSIQFNKANLSKSVLLKKSEIETGINIITLFNKDLQPISERKFFNNYNFIIPDIKLESIKKNNDSISLKFNIEGIGDNFNSSISILPLETTNNLNNNIISQFYLQPYVKGFIENPSYYFKDFSREKLYHLDLLLLNQGWSKYEWQEIFKGSKKIMYPFEKGLNLVGNLNNATDSENEILVHNSEYHLMKSIVLPPGENRFTMSGTYIVKGENLKFSLIDKNNKLSKPSLYLRVDQPYKSENLDLTWVDNAEPTLKDYNDQEFSEFMSNLKIIELGTVKLTGKKKEIIPRTQSVPAYLESKITLVDEELIWNFPNITDLIRSKGYKVIEGLQAFGSGAPDTAISNITITSRRSNGLKLIMDGVRMPTLDELINLPTSRIESFYFDKIGSFEGAMNGLNEVLYIFTRVGPTLAELNTEDFENLLSFTPKIAFEKPQKYYSPKYTNYSSEPYKKFGTVHWIPSVRSINHSISIMIPDYGLDNVKLFIEGMNPDGNLISKIITVNLD